MPNFNQYSLLKDLRTDFEVEPLRSRAEGMKKLNNEAGAVLLIEFPDDPNFVLLRDRSLGAEISPLHSLTVFRLHEEILKALIGLSQAAIDLKSNLLYPHTLQELDEMTSEIEYNASFILRATTSEEVLRVTNSGEFMPQKSTYFFPKLLSGLVFNELEPLLG